ncbi:hypothetical protein MRX96_022676 [Rhipicephalus microplus]
MRSYITRWPHILVKPRDSAFQHADAKALCAQEKLKTRWRRSGSFHAGLRRECALLPSSICRRKAIAPRVDRLRERNPSFRIPCAKLAPQARSVAPAFVDRCILFAFLRPERRGQNEEIAALHPWII